MYISRLHYFKMMIFPSQGTASINLPLFAINSGSYFWRNIAQIIHVRPITFSSKLQHEKSGPLQFFSQKFKLLVKKHKITVGGYYLYESVADRLDYESFMKDFQMPDTFNSWFLITELHVWMLMSLLMKEPSYGRQLRNCLVEAMWNDISTRSKKLGEEGTSLVKYQVQELFDEFTAAIFGYDEGLLGSDIVLAGAVWRRFLMRKESCTAQDLEILINYIRKTMVHLDKLNLEEFTKLKDKVRWIPLAEVHEDISKL